MQIIAVRTHKIESHDLLHDVLDKYITDLEDGDIIAITSKIISIIEGRVIKKSVIDKKSLIYQEADAVLKSETNQYDLYLTIKDGLLIPSAGIDESNVNDSYILYPFNVQETAAILWDYLKKKHHLDRLGVLITDSHTTIMRRGVTGIALGWCGFYPFYSYIGKTDIYNQKLRVTQINILDSLAVSAVFVMGEGKEQTPIAIVKQAPRVTFVNRIPLKEEEDLVKISMEEDLYAPLLKASQWE